MATDEYVAKLEAAREALDDLIMATEPGTGWKLHEAYTDIKVSLQRAEKRSAQTTAAAQHERDAELRQAWREARAAWRDLPAAVKQHAVLSALADDRLTVTETLERLSAAHPDAVIGYGGARSVLHQLIDTGDVTRSPFTHRGRQMWRYRRNTSLTGAIADLNRQIKETR